MENRSRYDPSRKTVGAIYRDAQMSHNGDPIEVGDMTREVMSSLVEDLNETIASDPFDGRPFYITVHEKKDLQMKNALLRRLIKTIYRPYPEDDTLVFYVNPRGNDQYFCWCLPHWSEMQNMLNNDSLYDPQMIYRIKAWKRHDLVPFGFVKDSIGNWMSNPEWKDEKMVQNVQPIRKILIA